MLPIAKIILMEATTRVQNQRVPEPEGVMSGEEQVEAYAKAYEWGGPTSALVLHHLRELSTLIKPNDIIVDLACGPGPLLLELAALYPTTNFIGVDLSPVMLGHLEKTAKERGLSNIRVVLEDIRTLKSFEASSVDLVISTSSLHHLPDDQSLHDLFQRIEQVLKPTGGVYLFDFCLLKSASVREIFVKEVAKTAPALTTIDYRHSLDAAFPLKLVKSSAEAGLQRPYSITRSAFVDFFYIVRTTARTSGNKNIEQHLHQLWKSLSLEAKLEHLMIRKMSRTEMFQPSSLIDPASFNLHFPEELLFG